VAVPAAAKRLQVGDVREVVGKRAGRWGCRGRPWLVERGHRAPFLGLPGVMTSHGSPLGTAAATILFVSVLPLPEGRPLRRRGRFGCDVEASSARNRTATRQARRKSCWAGGGSRRAALLAVGTGAVLARRTRLRARRSDCCAGGGSRSAADRMVGASRRPTALAVGAGSATPRRTRFSGSAYQLLSRGRELVRGRSGGGRGGAPALC